ncbi:hypothetical protein [Kibdelosporangium aridum]|uniref:Uncharacterized protein n=1 Tax=Kibdelosporangium aridum TaxID=2030 RepID=A0A1Y5X5P2_KIBAR|nr:hypothetical protein [Kibdelosporangium aridum]SMC72605.1 hypothetical protein SAMN05661093_01709 [Kibdelosporangium aridum]
MAADYDYPDWYRQPDETIRLGNATLMRHVGSRIAGRIQVPHPPAPGAPELVERDYLPHHPLEMTSAGRFTGHDWVEDDSIGYWAEATHPEQDAAKVADAMAICHGDAGFMVTDRRVSVITAAHLFVYVREAQKQARRKKGIVRHLLGTATDAVLGTHNSWGHGDLMVALWEADVRRIRGWSRVWLGRSFPFPNVVRVDFVDGSVLYCRCRKGSVIDGQEVRD